MEMKIYVFFVRDKRLEIWGNGEDEDGNLMICTHGVHIDS